MNNETAEKLTEALNNLSNSLDAFTSIHPDGIRLSDLTNKTLSEISDNLKNINQGNG